jgi:hypothetical protein
MEKYYLIEIRGATTVQRQIVKMNDLHYEYISVNYDYILSRHLIAGTEFDYLLTPENYHRLFPVCRKFSFPKSHQSVGDAGAGDIFDGTGNNAVNTRKCSKRLRRSTLILIA